MQPWQQRQQTATIADLEARIRELERKPISTNSPVLDSGVYTPTLTNVTNIVTSAAVECQYFRVGNTVTVSGAITTVDPTAAAESQIDVSLPIASNLGADGDLGGAAANGIGNFVAGVVKPNTTSNRASIIWTAISASAGQALWFIFTYQIVA